MAKFTDDVVLKILRGTSRYELFEEFRYFQEVNHKSVIYVPKGLITDLASIPRILWWMLPPNGPYTKSAILHDYLCNMNTLTREMITGIHKGDKVINGVSLPEGKVFLIWGKKEKGNIVISRKVADKIFLESMLVTGCNKFTSYLMYYAVRLFAIVVKKK